MGIEEQRFVSVSVLVVDYHIKLPPLFYIYRFYEATKLRNQFENILEESKMLSNRISDNQLSKSDRMRRHGEVRMLKAIKRKQKNLEPRQRKILKHSNVVEEEADSKDTAGDDLRDVDFRLQNNTAKLEVHALEMQYQQ